MGQSKLPLFTTLRAMRDFERRELPFLETREDQDLVSEIGYRQAARRPATLKALMLLGAGSVATVQRRLRRLRELRVIEQRRCAHDRRAVEIVLAPKVLKSFARYEDLLRRGAAAGAPYRGAASAPAPARARKSAARRRGKAPEHETAAPTAPGEPRNP